MATIPALEGLDQPPVLPAHVARVTPEGKPTRYTLDWEEFTHFFYKQALTGLDSRVTTVESTATTDIATLTARVRTEETTRADADGAMAQRIVTVEADYKAADRTTTARIETEETARVNADAALATRTTTLEASVNTPSTGNNPTFARLLTEEGARATADSALASRASSLEAEVSAARSGSATLKARVDAVDLARVNGDNALAARVSTVETTSNNNSASITTLQSSMNGVQVKYGVQGYVNGVTGGFVLTGILKNDGSVAYNLEIDSNVTINGNLVVNGTLGYQKLAANSVTNHSPTVSGTIISTGTATLSTSFTTRGGGTVVVTITGYEPSSVKQRSNVAPTAMAYTPRTLPLTVDGVTRGNLQSFDACVGVNFSHSTGTTEVYVGNYVMAPAAIEIVITGLAAGAHTFTLTNPYDINVAATMSIREFMR